jgi:hypothetical protein
MAEALSHAVSRAYASSWQRGFYRVFGHPVGEKQVPSFQMSRARSLITEESQLIPVDGRRSTEQPLVMNFSQLIEKADLKVVENKKLFLEIGRYCKNMDAANASLHTIVKELRQKRIFLKDTASREVAKCFIRESHSRVDPNSLERYMRNLLHLISTPEEQIPERPSITQPLPFWVSIGDEVDSLFGD